MIKPGMFISDRYEIIDKVGSGGMADVYKAKCHRLNRFVAIKILKPEYSNDKNFVSKFRVEAQSAAGLSHPNIVNVYDVGDDEGLYYIVMELVEGITLKRFIERKGKLEIKEALGIAIQIAQGMEAAHSNHIIHRDIKPQNIIISRDGKVKVADFGIAKAASSNTVTQTALGSVHYLSPEQARGGYSDEKSDIYSLGVTLYEMLTGILPFAGDNTVSVALLHIQSEAQPVREIDSAIPVSVDKIVQKCMQKKPERRYLTASSLITDLKRSIVNPDGDFVELSNGNVTDSPTIHMTEDEMQTIKSAAKKPTVYYDSNISSTKDKIKSNDKNISNNLKSKELKKMQREDEEDIDSIDSRLEKFFVAGTIAVVVMIGIAVIYFVAKFFDFFGPSDPKADNPSPTPTIVVTEPPAPTGNADTDEILIPPVIGLSYDEARKELESYGLIVRLGDDEYSSEFKKDMIISQEPASGTSVQKNSIVTLIKSLGPERKEIIDVRNMSLQEAIDTLSKDFTVKPKYENNDEIAEDMIIKTLPEAGEYAYKDDEVIIVVSLGPDKSLAVVPDIMSKTVKEAKSMLELAGLNPGKESYAHSDKYPKDQICFQSTTAGEKVSIGSVIDYSISLGPKIIVYSSTLDLSDNPFEPDEGAVVVLELYQIIPGTEEPYTKNFFTGYMDYDDFASIPKKTVESSYGGSATVYLYVDGTVRYIYPITMLEKD